MLINNEGISLANRHCLWCSRVRDKFSINLHLCLQALMIRLTLHHIQIRQRVRWVRVRWVVGLRVEKTVVGWAELSVVILMYGKFGEEERLQLEQDQTPLNKVTVYFYCNKIYNLSCHLCKICYTTPFFLPGLIEKLIHQWLSSLFLPWVLYI